MKVNRIYTPHKPVDYRQTDTNNNTPVYTCTFLHTYTPTQRHHCLNDAVIFVRSVPKRWTPASVIKCRHTEHFWCDTSLRICTQTKKHVVLFLAFRLCKMQEKSVLKVDGADTKAFHRHHSHPRKEHALMHTGRSEREIGGAWWKWGMLSGPPRVSPI